MVSQVSTLRKKWATGNADRLSRGSLIALLRNEIPAIRIPGFATAEECACLAVGAENAGFDFYENVEPKIGRIGITQFEHGVDAPRYFKGSRYATERRLSATRSAFNPVERMIQTIAAVWDGSVSLAFEPRYQQHYFAGLIRQINVALLHLDWAPLDAPGWEIEDVRSQLAWNLYVRSPAVGGQCVVHDRLWLPSDEACKIRGSYAYAPADLAEHEVYNLVPTVGDVTLFNSQNFHEVVAGGKPGERITVSSFIGWIPQKQLVLWS